MNLPFSYIIFLDYYCYSQHDCVVIVLNPVLAAMNYHLSQADPLARRQNILKLGIDPNEILSAAEVWVGLYKTTVVETQESKMNMEAVESDKVGYS